MTLVDVQAILLGPISTYVIADQSFDVFTKIVASSGEWLKPCHVRYK